MVGESGDDLDPVLCLDFGRRGGVGVDGGLTGTLAHSFCGLYKLAVGTRSTSRYNQYETFIHHYFS